MLFTLIFPFILQFVTSSLVLDGIRQQGLYVSDYCPKMKYCAEGTHTMCMYYNPHQVFGPKCNNPQNVSMTSVIAEKLLDISNAIRGKIARGTERGKDGELLPRGYGMFKLAWDKELATFAQVFANQCYLQRDMCRATKQFPEPGQVAGITRFTPPDWYLMSKSFNFTTKGLNDEKLQYATVQIVKAWYKFKTYVDKELISKYPVWLDNPEMVNSRFYLDMIYGPATHMGCGISAYDDFTYTGYSGQKYQTVQIVCNFSTRPQSGNAVYNTVPPGDAEIPISKCGCPAGSEEDDNCLCVIKEGDKDQPSSSTKDCNDGSCDPTVVVLPIFTMEDTPPDQIFSSLSNSTVHKSTELRDRIFDEYENNHLRSNHNNMKYSNVQSRQFKTLQQDRQKSDKKVSIKKRNFDKKETENYQVDSRYSRQSIRMPPNHVQKKSSIFTRASRFSLPTTRSNKQYGSINPIIRDVIPRKDFTNAKNLVDKYINYGKTSFFTPIVRKSAHYSDNDLHHLENIKDLHEIIKPHNGEEVLSHNTESSLNLIEQNVVHHNDFMKDLAKDSIFNHNEPIQSITATTDNKLMNLLDTLEREVKHIELKDKDKEIFDEKIRKIYGKVVGKSAESLGIKLTIPDKQENNIHIDDHLENLRTDRDDHLDKLRTDRDDHFDRLQTERDDPLNKLRTNRDEPLNKLRTDRNDHLDRFITDRDDHLDKHKIDRDEPLNKLRTDRDDHLDKYITDRDDNLEKLRTDRDDHLDKLKTDTDDHLNKLRTDRDDHLDKRRTDRDDPLDKFRSDRDDHFDNLRTNRDDPLDKFRTERVDHLGKLRNNRDDLIDKHRPDRDDNLDKLRTGRDDLLDKFRTDRDDHLDKLRNNRDDSLNKLRTDTDDHLDKLRTDRDDHLDKFRNNRDDPLDKLRTDREDHLDKLRTGRDDPLDKLRTDLDDHSDKFRTNRDDHLDKLRTNRDDPLNKLRTDRNDNLDTLRTDRDDHLDKLKTDSDDSKNKLRTDRDDHLGKLRTDKDDRLDKLRADKRMFNEHSDIFNKHELHKNKNDFSYELYDDPTAANHHTVQKKVRDRSLYRNNDFENIYRNKNSYRNIEHNGIDSHENKYENFDINYRKDPYKREHYSRKSLSMHANREDHNSNHKNYYLNHEGDPLSDERRKYYQDKLNNIERRIKRVRNHKRRTVTEDRHMRAMITPHVRKSGNQMDSFYIPDRARFLHGY